MQMSCNENIQENVVQMSHSHVKVIQMSCTVASCGQVAQLWQGH